MSEEKNYYYDDIGDRAADAGIYDEFEGASTGGRRSAAGEKSRMKKKRYRRVKKNKNGSRSGNPQKPVDNQK